MIAGTALHATVPLVTGNVAHYERIVGLGYPLIIENWRAVSA
jgi:predicted nucleic acid-binding protein